MELQSNFTSAAHRMFILSEFTNFLFRLHGSINDYVFGEGAFDQLMSQLLNQAEAQQKGLSEDELKSLEKTSIKEEQVENGAQCTTCMENFELNEPVIKLPCGHFYHEQCIIPWLKKV
jgi:E3 ubiquitin-protein ligase RNF115/126